MNSFEFELWIEQYKVIIKDKGERPLFDSEITKLDENINFIPDEYKSAFTAALGGDFSKFEKLPHLLRNYLGALELKKFREKFGDTPSLESEEVRNYLEEKAMNAAFRAGISAEKNAAKTRESAKAIDVYMNGVLMKRTMMPPTEEEKGALRDQLGEADIEKNKARQLVMAKAMLLAQLGRYDVIDKNGLSKGLDVPVYETLVHGNRTNFILPGGENSGNVIDVFMGANGGADAGIEKRTAATHSVKRRAFGEGGIVKSECKELRTYSPFKIFGNQYGMDIAAGGIGKEGPDQKIITGNGESGHMYMRAEKGDVKHCGSLLIGIEGSAPAKESYLGNSHGIRAKSAKQSAFLADKAIVGKKVGGRQIDLSGISAEKLVNILDRFSEKYSSLQQNAGTKDGREKLSALNDMLMGKRMDLDKVMEMFETLGMADKDLKDVVSQARSGYLCKVDPKAVSADEFTQSIRKGFSQEQACNLANARFAYAEDDLRLSVGAIKELIFTHETRSLGWKILHPIKNYRENATISSLIERLETDKHFDKEQIASAFGYYDDTFSMDWGSELSNDREAALFQRENRRLFKASDYKLLGVLRSFYKGKAAEVTSQKDRGLETTAAEEVEEMQEELAKIENGEDLEDTFDRESIIVTEEDEMNKSVDDLSVIIPEQPTAIWKKEL